MRALVLVVVAACAVQPERPATHPASPDAPTGRLAPAPPSLRPGVANYTEVPPLRAPDEGSGGDHHHHHGK